MNCVQQYNDFLKYLKYGILLDIDFVFQPHRDKFTGLNSIELLFDNFNPSFCWSMAPSRNEGMLQHKKQLKTFLEFNQQNFFIKLKIITPHVLHGISFLI